MEVNESPIFLRLDPTPTADQRDLPVYLYESGARAGHAVAGSVSRLPTHARLRLGTRPH